MQGYNVGWKAIPLLRPASHWHARIVNFETGAVRSWDFAAKAFDADAEFGDTCQALTFDTVNNGHFFTPPPELDPGDHLLQLIDAETPAVTDQPVCKLFRWNQVNSTITWIGDL